MAHPSTRTLNAGVRLKQNSSCLDSWYVCGLGVADWPFTQIAKQESVDFGGRPEQIPILRCEFPLRQREVPDFLDLGILVVLIFTTRIGRNEASRACCPDQGDTT